MVEIAITVENYRSDASLESFLSYQFTDFFCLLNLRHSLKA